MAITLNGTTGITTPDIDTDGLSVDTNAIFVDPATNNVGIGTSSPNNKLELRTDTTTADNAPSIFLNNRVQTTSSYHAGGIFGGAFRDIRDPCYIAGIDFLRNSVAGGLASAGNIIFYTDSQGETLANLRANSERMRIDSSGNLLLAATSASGKISTFVGPGQVGYHTNKSSAGGGLDHAQYFTDGTLQGKITQNGSFTTVSDYRRKSDVTPLTGMLEKVCKLKPVSYTLTAFDKQQFGFIAHELQEELPVFVDGEKDAVNEDGSIAPQSVDYPKIVSALTAAIQEQQTLIQALTARIEALEQA